MDNFLVGPMRPFSESYFQRPSFGFRIGFLNDLGRVDKRDSHWVLTVIQAVICDGDQLGTRPDVRCHVP